MASAENDYETQRLANMAANRQRFQTFGLHDAAKSIAAQRAKAVRPSPLPTGACDDVDRHAHVVPDGYICILTGYTHVQMH